MDINNNMDVRLLTNITNRAQNNANINHARNNPLSEDLQAMNTTVEQVDPSRTWRISDGENAQSLQAMIQQSNRQTEAFRQMVERLLLNQANRTSVVNGQLMVEIDEATRAQAQADIAEDGFFGVEQTSQRLFDFAVAFAGDDPERLAVMRDAVLRGFAAAERAWGGNLPEISHQTLEATMNLFDQHLERINEGREATAAVAAS
ncbi:MAG: hypothetical protein FWB71_04070 [Defluviitaleaceae bacterium]|nr:hypothetical protein [Defluviitaleaceae bacterium]